jgi:transposase
MPKRSPGKEAYWRKMLRRQQRSGLTVRQFCKDHELSEASFFSWKREIAIRDRQAAGTTENGSSSSRVKPAVAQQVNPSPFIPLRLTGTSTIELVHPRGHVLRIPAGFDGDCLQKVLQLLDRERDA